MTYGHPTQLLTLDTLSGTKRIKAPDRWWFDKTATIAWAKLLDLMKEPQAKTKREEYAKDRQIYILALVLANSLGMAPPYWTEAARKLCRES